MQCTAGAGDAPVRAILLRSRIPSAAIPDQAPGSGPLRVLLDTNNSCSLVRALQAGGRVPVQHTQHHMVLPYVVTLR
jgi:hypothetical protein